MKNNNELIDIKSRRPNKIIFFVVGLIFGFFGIIIPIIIINYIISKLFILTLIPRLIISILIVFLVAYSLGTLIQRRTKDNFSNTNKLINK